MSEPDRIREVREHRRSLGACRRRLAGRILALAAVAAVAGCGEEGGEAKTAQSFVESIGVNVHMSYDDTAYGDPPAVRAAVRELGVRHVRDGIVLGRADQYAALRGLAADGARANLILGDPQGRFGTGSLDEQLATLREELEGVAESVEGPNEYDTSGDPAWPRVLRDYQARLHGLVRSDPELGAVEVVGPSLVDGSAWGRVGDLTGSLDYGNIHPYPGGEPPAERHVEGQLDLVRPASRSRPVIATETGYHNAIEAAGGRQQPGVSERAAAAYIPILLLEHFRAGIARTYLYELADERPEPERRDPEQHFGLVRSDFTRKPAFASLRNTIGLLTDPGGGFEPGRLEYDLDSGVPVAHLLLQKRDGRFYIALWRNATAVWSKAARTDVAPRPGRVRVRFGEDAARVRSFAPVRSTEPVGSWRDAAEVSVELGGEPLLLEVDP